MFSGPLPQAQENSWVTLDGHPLRYLPGSYKCVEAPRFGDKISIGELKYGDFTPFDSAHSITTLIGGYGLRRYSDHTDRELASVMFNESSNIDTRNVPITLAPYQLVCSLPTPAAPPVWGGEITIAGTTYYVVVAGTKVYKVNADFTLTTASTATDTGITLPAAARVGAVGIFNNQLIIGFGASAPAVYTANLITTASVVDSTAQPQYIFAFVADHSGTYIAGGTLSTNCNTVLASTDGVSDYDVSAIVTCGGSGSQITSLSPGGGVALVYVGKETEMGGIAKDDGRYEVLIPYDSRLSTNSQPARWSMGSGSDEQRGLLQLYFARERSLWTYQPSTQDTGTAQNISPWGDPRLRPQNVRGRITAIQGSARWLYFSVKNRAGHTWVLALDLRTQRPHIVLDLGLHDCTFLGITSLLASNPILNVGYGNNLVQIALPLDGESPIDDVNDGGMCRFCATGSLWSSSIDLGFPDEDKIAFICRVIADGLVADHVRIHVYAAVNGGSYTLLGTADQSPSTEIVFSPTVVVKRIDFRLDFESDDRSLTPEMLGFTVRLSLNTRLFRIWQFDALIPTGSLGNLTDDLDDPRTVIRQLWTSRKAGTPVNFKDRWGDPWVVRIWQLGETEAFRETDRTPETRVSFVLLEFSEGAEPSISWVSSAATGSFIPITLGA